MTPAQLHLLDIYARRLLEENRRTNLTGEQSRAAIYRRHLAESLALLAAIESLELPLSPLIDVGSGAGFPGLPIKIARPDLDVTLLEATGKKARFLESVVSELQLTSIQAIHGRAEELAHEGKFRESFPVATARAVAPLRVLLELTLPFVKAGGVVVAPKGSGAQREMREAGHALEVLGGEIVSSTQLNLPYAGVKPTLVLIRKVRTTPKTYPRRPGIPNKRPL